MVIRLFITELHPGFVTFSKSIGQNGHDKWLVNIALFTYILLGFSNQNIHLSAK